MSKGPKQVNLKTNFFHPKYWIGDVIEYSTPGGTIVVGGRGRISGITLQTNDTDGGLYYSYWLEPDSGTGDPIDESDITGIYELKEPR